MAEASAAVELTRLARISALNASFQRCSPTPTPARLTAASAPSTVDGSSGSTLGRQVTSSGVSASRRTRRTTSCPAARSRSTSAVPRNPDDPPMTIRMPSILPEARPGRPTDLPALQTELRLELPGLQALLQRAEEPGGIGAVDQAVVVGQGEVDHRARHDDLAQVRVVDDDGPLDDRAGTQDAHL